MIDVSHVKQAFDKKVILEDVNFSMKEGEIIGLLGPSGSGKTTLIKTLIGMIRPTEGSIYVLGTKQPSLKPMKNIGYMAQSDALYEELTAKANLAYFGRLYGLKGKKLKKRIQECLSLVDLNSDMKKPVHKYSGGMKRRLSLAISLIHEPKIIFLDEPTVGIDPALKHIFWNEFKNLRSKGMSFLVSTHVMDEAERCDRLLFIKNKQLFEVGTPEKLIQTYDSIDEAFMKVGEKSCIS